MKRSLRDSVSIAARRLQATALHLTGRTERRIAGRRDGVAVLMYHRVLRDEDSAAGIAPGMFVRASTFDRQLRWLTERFTVVSLGEQLRSARAGGERPSVALTFDDGWRDNLTVAWPILRRHGVPATIFLVRDYSEAGERAAGEFLQPSEIRDLAAQGLEFGAHTVSHPDLRKLTDAQVENELRLSQQAVEAWTGRSCPLFAYPYGHHTQATADVARRIFAGSVIVGGGWWTLPCDPARIPRIGIHEDVSFTRALFEQRLAA